MKKITPILIGLALGTLGFYFGQEKGYNEVYNSAERIFKQRKTDEIKAELKEREQTKIEAYINGKAGIETVDEGSLFKIKYVQYFSGTLSNSALLATVKDIKLNVDYYSKTGTKIGNQEVMIYEFIKPGQSINFKEKINVPDKVEDFKYQILKAKAE